MRATSIRIAILLSMLWLTGDLTQAAAPPGAAAGRQAAPGLVVVKLRPLATKTVLESHGLRDLQPVSRRPGVAKPGGVDLSRVLIARYDTPTPPAKLAAALSQLPQVEYAEPLYAYPLAVVPNDVSYGSQVAYLSTRMRFPQAWDIAKGEQGNVVVAIVDGGTEWTHIDLSANVWSNPGEIPGNGIDDDANGYVDDIRGWNFANDSNNPAGLNNTPESAAHGTHTAGIVCAVANNAIGIAGASWNAKVMPICTSDPTADNIILFGYPGIVYAAENGADIVNCSWGGLGGASNFEQEVIDFAWQQGTAVVAAAGNQNSEQTHYPSGYRHVLSVANVSNSDVRNPSSNNGFTVDVSAQGSSILSTVPGNAYGLLTGTSMSSPHAAAVCALIKTRWPGYSADQVMERCRVTSDNIDGVNPSRAGKLGFGRVNAEKALTKNTPALRITDVQIAETNGNGVIEPGETVTLTLSVTNYLASTTGISFSLTENSTFATVNSGNANLASLDSLASATLPPFSLDILPTAPLQHAILCTVAIATTSPAYSDKDRFELVVLPVFVNHNIGKIRTSVTSVGKLGFSLTLGGNGSDGVGFKYDGGPNLLFEGAMIMATSAVQLSNAARTSNPSSSTGDNDFATLPGGVPQKLEPGPLAPQQTTAWFNDSLSTSRVNVRVRQETFAYSDPTHDDYVILRYVIRNTGINPLNGLRVGWFCDWDIDGASFATNRTGLDAARNLGYVYDTGSGPLTHIGIRVLNSAGVTGYRGIYNDHNAPNNPSWGLFDGFSDLEKWEAISTVNFTEAGPADISQTIGTGPFTVSPGDSVEVGFAFLGADDLTALQVNADAAALKWQHLHSGTPVVIQDLTAAQEHGDVVLRFRAESETDLVAYRVFRAADGGRFEPLAPDIEPNARKIYAFRDPDPAPGRYAYRIGEVAPDGGVVLHGWAEVEVALVIPRLTFLDPPAPNPFNPTTTLRFGIAVAGPIELAVFDARGRRVRTLLQTPAAAAGFHRITWDGRNDRGSAVASGVYHVRLRAAGRIWTRRLTLLK